MGHWDRSKLRRKSDEANLVARVGRKFELDVLQIGAMTCVLVTYLLVN